VLAVAGGGDAVRPERGGQRGLGEVCSGLTGGAERHPVEERRLRVGEVCGLPRDDHVVDEGRGGVKLVRDHDVPGRGIEDRPHTAGGTRDEEQVAPRVVLHPGRRYTIGRHQRRSFTGPQVADQNLPARGGRERPRIKSAAVSDRNPFGPEVGWQRDEIGKRSCCRSG
jgi:hypothetical protein